MIETLSLKGEKKPTHFVAAFSVCFIKLIAIQQVNEPQESCRFQSNHCKLQDRKRKITNIANLLQELIVIPKEINLIETEKHSFHSISCYQFNHYTLSYHKGKLSYSLFLVGGWNQSPFCVLDRLRKVERDSRKLSFFMEWKFFLKGSLSKNDPSPIPHKPCVNLLCLPSQDRSGKDF